jgi:hypothetical protein
MKINFTTLNAIATSCAKQGISTPTAYFDATGLVEAITTQYLKQESVAVDQQRIVGNIIEGIVSAGCVLTLPLAISTLEKLSKAVGEVVTYNGITCRSEKSAIIAADLAPTIIAWHYGKIKGSHGSISHTGEASSDVTNEWVTYCQLVQNAAALNGVATSEYAINSGNFGSITGKVAAAGYASTGRGARL